jgi:hypothetical protein
VPDAEADFCMRSFSGKAGKGGFLCGVKKKGIFKRR